MKLALHQDLIERYIKKERYPEGSDAFSLWTEGREFVIEDWPERPKDFPCDWAWADIQRDVAMIMFGANPPWMADEGMALACCSDGFRPVSSLVERIAE